MVEGPLSAQALGIIPPEHQQASQEEPTTQVAITKRDQSFAPALTPEIDPLPSSLDLKLKPNSLFARTYDELVRFMQEGATPDPKTIALIVLADEIAAGLSIEDATFKVSNNIYAQRKPFSERSGLEIFNASEEHGKPAFSIRKIGDRVPAKDARNVRDTELFSHPENFGDTGSDIRIIAGLLFSRSLEKRGSSREILFEEFTAQYKLYHPDASSKTIVNSFTHGLSLLEGKLAEVDSGFSIPRARGHNNNAIIKIKYEPIPTPITLKEKTTPRNDVIPATPTTSLNEQAETEGEEQDAIDASVFGESTTILLQYLLGSKKPRTLQDISIIRRREGKSGPVLSKEVDTARLIISTLQLVLPQGVELRNSSEQNGKPIIDRFEVYPKDITIQQIIELKKQELEATRIAQLAERVRQEAKRKALEAERLEKLERMRIEAETARAERIETERIALEERAREEKLAKFLELALNTTFDLLETIKPATPPLQTPQHVEKPLAQRFQMKPDVAVEIPKAVQIQKQPEIIMIDGKVGVTGEQFETLMTLLSIDNQQGMTPREITSIKLNGRYKSRDAAMTERHLEDLKRVLAATPIKISHPENEDGVVDSRRYIVSIPEGNNLRNYITIL